MNLDEFAVDIKKPEPCNGLRFRYREFGFRTSRGGYKNGFELVPLAKQSCPGCAYCGGYWIEDVLSEDEYRIEIGENVVDGDVIELDTVVDSYDWETGYVDSCHVIARKVPE